MEVDTKYEDISIIAIVLLKGVAAEIVILQLIIV